jgi:hypothetical protein
VVVLRLLPAVLLAALLIGCGGDGDGGAATTTSTTTRTAAAGAGKQATGTVDSGARRCTRTAFLAGLLADVALLPFKIETLKCKGEFARTRFVPRGCAPGQTADGIPCGSTGVAVWRRGARRWRLIAYSKSLSCAEIRKQAGDFPQSLCS